MATPETTAPLLEQSQVPPSDEQQDGEGEAVVGLVVSAPKGYLLKRHRFPSFQCGFEPASLGNPLPASLARFGMTDAMWQSLMEDVAVNVARHRARRAKLRWLTVLVYVICMVAASKIPDQRVPYFWLLSIVVCALVAYLYIRVARYCCTRPRHMEMQSLVETWLPRLEEECDVTIGYIAEEKYTVLGCCQASESYLTFRPAQQPNALSASNEPENTEAPV